MGNGIKSLFPNLVALSLIVGLTGCSEPSIQQPNAVGLQAEVERLAAELSETQQRLEHLEERLELLATTGWLNTSFHAAAVRYEVPVDLLKAISFYETRWSHRSGSYPSTDRRYGLMGLRQHSTLPRAVKLLGLSQEVIVTNPVENIHGGAAVLQDIWKEQNGNAPLSSNPAEWNDVLQAYSGLDDKELRKSYATNVLRLLNQGTQATKYGEELSIGGRQ